MFKRTENYYKECVNDEKKMPYMEELGLKLGVDTDTINNWSNDERIEKFGTIKRKIKELQRLRLMQRGLEDNKPVMSIFLLKANHGLIEVDKHINQEEKVSIIVSDVGYNPNKNYSPKPESSSGVFTEDIKRLEEEKKTLPS